ncbi:MAG: universal stress protein [Nitrososphaerota archaeon]|nr:universal stress protein [Candidatus Nezhaarchaeota archaeon]MDW8049739.1 universal stress protein [Nitrososphaerota archaeon]
MGEAQERIVVYVDGSEASWRAFDKALRHAKRSMGKLYVIYVVDADFLSSISSSQRAEVERDLVRVGASILSEAEKKASSMGVELVKILKRGSIQNEILKLASEVKADYVYVAPRPEPIIRKLLFGSISDTLIKKAPCPVVIVKVNH